MGRKFLYQPDADPAGERAGAGAAQNACAHIYIGNLGRELSPAAASLSLADKLDPMEQHVGKKIIDGVVVGPKVDVSGIGDRVVVQEREASDIKISPRPPSCCARRGEGDSGIRLGSFCYLMPFPGPLPQGEGENATGQKLRCRNKQIPQLMQLIADLRGLFELQVSRMPHHLPFQLVDLLLQRFRRQRDGILFHH